MLKKLYLPVISLIFLSVFPFQNGTAEVLSSSESGFHVTTTAAIGGAAGDVYDTLIRHIHNWWDPAHTFSGDSGNLTLDATAGGCFCEALPNGGSVRHLEVVFVSPGKTLRLTGALGPLQSSGLAGSMTWNLEENGDSTAVELSYSVGGYCEGGLETIAPVVDSVLRGQLLRLKAYVESK